MSKFYAVRAGKKPGIYTTWAECEEQIKGFTGPKYKKFSTKEEAQEFVDAVSGSGPATSKTKRSSGEAGVSKRDRSRSPLSKGEAAVNVYTDGACFNIKTDQVGGIGVFWGEDDERNLSEKIAVDDKLTKNGAEILAAKRAIEIAVDEGLKSINIHTDNTYLFNCATKWMGGWKKKNWKNSSGEDVGNKKEILELNSVMNDKIEIEWKMEKGTSDMKEADKLSNVAARKKE